MTASLNLPTLTGNLPLAERTDPELLRLFADDSCEAAFDVLVRRYGTLVLGVCRRVLHDDHDTEDAFQATFLVLARKAGTIRKHESLASWLYKVAYRIAVRVRAGKARRRAREREAIQHLATFSPGLSHGPYLGEFLDSELQRLPEKYRTPVLLCYLQGASNEEAARRLRCPTGTLKIRLLRARQLLRKRLERRGVALAMSALMVGLVNEARATVPPAWQTRVVELAVQSAFSPLTHGLVKAALQRMCRAKLKVALALLVAVLLCAGTDSLIRPVQGADNLPIKTKMYPPDRTPDAPQTFPTQGDLILVAES
jgi:RNA polymerase sigma factor (sigma-70 family)